MSSDYLEFPIDADDDLYEVTLTVYDKDRKIVVVVKNCVSGVRYQGWWTFASARTQDWQGKNVDHSWHIPADMVSHFEMTTRWLDRAETNADVTTARSEDHVDYCRDLYCGGCREIEGDA